MIFGKLGFDEYGIEGAAIASLSAEIAAFLFLTGVILWRGYNRTYAMLNFTRWKPLLFKKLVSISTTVSLEALVGSVKWFLFFLIIEQLGEQQLGIASIIFSCYAVLLIPIDSFSESACSMASNLIGQKRQRDLTVLIRRIIVFNYAVTFPVLILSMIFPENILAIFTADEVLVAYIIASLVVVALAILVAVPAEALFSTIVGTGDTRAILNIQIVTTIVTLICVYAAAFILTLELHFIWMAEVFGWLVCLLLLA